MMLTRDRWRATDDYFAAFGGEDDLRGWMSAINLPLLRRARPRWSDQLSCIPLVGLCMGFKSMTGDLSGYVRVEPRPDYPSGPVVAVTLHVSTLRWPRDESVVGATICRLETADAVLESYLLQIGDEERADTACPFWAPTTGQ